MIVNPPAIIAIAFLALAEPEGLSVAEDKPTIWTTFVKTPFINIANKIEMKLPNHLWARRPIAYGITAASAVIAGSVVVSAVVAGATLAIIGTPIWIVGASTVSLAALVAGVAVALSVANSGGSDGETVIGPIGEPNEPSPVSKIAKITKISFVFENNNFYDKKLAKDFEFIATVDNGEPHKFEGMDKEEFLGKTIESFVNALPKQNEPIKIKLPIKQDGLETLIPPQLNDIKKTIENAAKKQQKSVVVEIVEHTSK